MYKLEPETVEIVKTLSQGHNCSESAVVEKALRWYFTAGGEDCDLTFRLLS